MRCADDTLYTGIAKDVLSRVDKHNSGRGAKYTKTRTPVELVWQAESGGHGDALRKERSIKRLTRAAKLRLIRCGHESRSVAMRWSTKLVSRSRVEALIRPIEAECFGDPCTLEGSTWWLTCSDGRPAAFLGLGSY